MKQWGLLPPYPGKPVRSSWRRRTYSAIGEETAQKRAYVSAALVLGFREWQHREVPGRRTPLKALYDRALKGTNVLAPGGLWSGDTYTLFTRAANPLMAEIRNTTRRMPKVITLEHQELWLSPRRRVDGRPPSSGVTLLRGGGPGSGSGTDGC